MKLDQPDSELRLGLWADNLIHPSSLRDSTSSGGSGVQGADYLRELMKSPQPKELAFSIAEYQARVAKVRSRLEAMTVDLLLVTSPLNLCYLAGYSTFSVICKPACLFPGGGS